MPQSVATFLNLHLQQFFMNDKDGLAIFVLTASFMADAVIPPALNSYHLLLFAFYHLLLFVLARSSL